MRRTRWGCRSTLSFFVRPVFDDPDTIRTYQFFLVYHGNGYTQHDVESMPIDELQMHVDRLFEHLTEERRAQEAAAQRATRRR